MTHFASHRLENLSPRGRELMVNGANLVSGKALAAGLYALETL